MRDKTIMLVSIDSTKKDGLSLIKSLEDYPDGWLRKEWVAREDYAPTVQLEKAEAENARLREYVTTVAKCFGMRLRNTRTKY